MDKMHCAETFSDKTPAGKRVTRLTGRAVCGVSAESKDGVAFVAFRSMSKNPARASLCADCLKRLEL